MASRGRLLRPPARVVAGLAGAVLALGALTACGADDERVTEGNVVQPGRPGEEASALPPGTTLPPSEDPFTEADVAFLVDMIPHHAQALEMAELAPERADDEQVTALASRIADVQQAEIDVYERWLAERGMAPDGSPENQRGDGDHGGDGGHADGHDMPGMVSDADLATLEQSTGAEFDRLWLQLMIAHHEGALDMAAERDGNGTNIRVDELAADVVVTQMDEIATMQEFLGRL